MFRVHEDICLINGDVELDHLDKKVSVGFLLMELSSFSLTLINILEML